MAGVGTIDYNRANYPGSANGFVTYKQMQDYTYSKDAINGALSGKLSLSGGTMSGDLDMGGNDITNVGTIVITSISVATATVSGNVTLTGRTASTPLYLDASKIVQSAPAYASSSLLGCQTAPTPINVTLGTSLSMSAGVLNTAQDIRTSASPAFVGATLSGGLTLSGRTASTPLYLDTSKVVQSAPAYASSSLLGCQTTPTPINVALGASLSMSAGTLNTAQDIRTSASPAFVGATLSGQVATPFLSTNGSGAIVAGSFGSGLTYNTSSHTVSSTIGSLPAASLLCTNGSSLLAATMGAGVTYNTGTTTLDLAVPVSSGSYFPTLTGLFGVSSAVSTGAWRWIKVGTLCTVSGNFVATLSGVHNAQVISASLPVGLRSTIFPDEIRASGPGVYNYASQLFFNGIITVSSDTGTMLVQLNMWNDQNGIDGDTAPGALSFTFDAN